MSIVETYKHVFYYADNFGENKRYSLNLFSSRRKWKYFILVTNRHFRNELAEFGKPQKSPIKSLSLISDSTAALNR